MTKPSNPSEDQEQESEFEIRTVDEPASETLVRRESTLMSVLRLMRVPNVFTAIADILVGFAFVNQSYEPIPTLILLVLASCCLYCAGMVLNDVFDLKQDSQERPERPIPSGAVSLKSAILLGWGLLGAGVLLATTAFLVHPVKSAGPLFFGFESTMVSLLLVASILLYDKFLKKTPIAPVLMGCCRFLNILLGMSLIDRSNSELIPAGLMIAGGMGVYVAGFTWFARGEAKEKSPQGILIFGLSVMVAGLAMIACLPYTGLALPPTVDPAKQHLLLFLIGIMSFSVLRHALFAISDPIPRNVQATIKQCILTLILFHAGICFWINTQDIQLALVVITLLFPAILLGRWFYST